MARHTAKRKSESKKGGSQGKQSKVAANSETKKSKRVSQ